MDFFDRLGDYFNAITAFVEGLIRRFFGSSNEREIRRIGFVREKDGSTTVIPGSTLDRIRELEPEFERQSDAELKETASRMRAKLADGKTLDDILPEAFAATREAGRRYLQMRHYDVQMVGGYILHTGRIAEMVTGEGKTLVATLPCALNAMAGHVHVVTVNDYLARRDMEWMAPIYMGLGLTVDAIQSQMKPWERRPSYEKDITYGTNNEFGFDYLRDNMKVRREDQVQGPLDFAIVDEIDNILIDEARTPLIISGPAYDDITKYPKADRIARQLVRGEHFEVKEKEHTCHMTDEGIRKAEELAGVESFYTAGNMEWPHLLDNSLKAHHLYKRDVNYVVENGEVVIVDEHTGRKMPGRQWSDGLHQAVEAKEGVRIKEVSQTLATITLQNYFKLYKKLGGMTGTAMTEANEFYKIYGLDVVAVPTNRPMQRINHPDVIFRTEKEKWQAVVDEIREVHETGRPILVGTVSIEKSERISNMLNKYGIKHAVLNAKFHEREAEIVAQAGRLGAVTIATNMAGRGTDIILGGNPEHMAWEELHKTYESRLEVPKSEWDRVSDEIAEREGMKVEGRKVAEVGGLHVIGTERHDARRIDLQLRGRAGRQGDPGSSRFFLSLEDDLMRIFAGETVKNILTRLGMQEGEAIESGMVTRQIEKAQRRVEERHFEARKNLLEYDEVMDHQRKEVYSYRQQILDGANCRELILEMIDRQVERWTRHFLAPRYRWDACASWASQQMGIHADWQDIRDMDKEQMVEFLTDEAHRQAEDLVAEQLDENLPEDAEQRDWNWQTLAGWANRHFGLNVNDRELKKIGRPDGADEYDRDEILRYLSERAREAIDRTDFAPLDTLLDDDFNVRTLCGWARHQYGLEITPEEIGTYEEIEEPIELLRERVRTQYREQEIKFPVAVGMTRFMGGQGQQSDRDGLIRWASDRFHTQLTEEDFKEKERPQIEDLLLTRSRTYLPDEERVVDQVDQYLSRAYPGAEANGHGIDDNEALRELIDFANREFSASLDVDDLKPLDRENARQTVLQCFDRRYRPELGQAERALLLEVLDSAWKEHLYYMDHLRQGIGLVGYAQKDPKVEYKREGMKAFDTMWDRIGEQVTSAIFRLEKESPQFVGSLWQITSTTHEEAAPAAEEYQQPPQEQRQETNQLEPGQEPRAVEPIRNREEKVGRNDPCPCGSGKKYKKCCGANM
ncbi:preprotein translocase subunit SecA [Maioricimonas sp. JC845]|uniref:preprotein translocase subunit SecA n=1 Tax=Maioricimonas sp. JC845 TaxID=3232138 RepID=UPI00345826CF